MSHKVHTTRDSGLASAWNDAITVAEFAALVSADSSFKLAMGNAILATLPTTDPLVTGSLWRNNGVLTVSAGA